MPDSADRKRFEDLLTRLLDDDIDEARLRELTALVKADAELSGELRLHLSMAGRLVQHENEAAAADTFVRSLEAALDAQQDGDDFVDKVVQMADQQSTESIAQVPDRMPWIMTVVSLAACLALAMVMLGREWWGSGDEPIDHGVAVISSLAGELSSESGSLVSGDTVVPGVLELESGYLALEFYRGARMTVAAPAKLELIDAQRVLCHYGKIRAQVPAVAKGFTVVTPESEVVDLGTEFAVEVGRKGETEIHVFDGEVEAYDAKRRPESKKLLTAGLAMKVADGVEFSAEVDRFSDLAGVEQMERSAGEALYRRWKAVSEASRLDERMIAYYDFEPSPDQPRNLINRAVSGGRRDGAIVGASWTDGPWSGKSALSFKRPGDRVRIHLPGHYDAITLATWVRVDGLDRSHSSLLLTDGYDKGEVHWQFRKSGDLVLGLRHRRNSGVNYVSDNVVDVTRLGRWYHLASVVDPVAKQVVHYLDGEMLTAVELKEASAMRFGDVSIGNWDRPISGAGEAVRNLNGQLAEMMVFGVALDASEIRRLALK